MSSDYGDCFGFRRSDESVRVSEGRFRTPAASAYKLGSFVQIDADNEGYLELAGADAKIVPGFRGLLVQEEAWDVATPYDASLLDTYDLGVAKADRLSVIVTGAGVKFWLKNRASSTRADGRALGAVTMFATASIAVGNGIKWDGSKFVNVAADDAAEVARVTYYNSDSGLLEAVLVK